MRSPQHHNRILALMLSVRYMNVVLLSAVGYGDILPVTVQNKMFILVLLISALAVIGVQVQNLGQYCSP